ncbi:unnamed protein product, partial [Ascophyllum nodosum]
MNTVSKHQIQPEYGDEQADVGRDCRTRIARPNSQPCRSLVEEINDAVQVEKGASRATEA